MQFDIGFEGEGELSVRCSCLGFGRRFSNRPGMAVQRREQNAKKGKS
jgi:hypothetical protein